MNIAIITGASSGLGVEFLKALEKYPLDEIIIIARRRERLIEIASSARSCKVTPLALDITLESDLNAVKELLTRQNATVKFLINNAGKGLLSEFQKSESDALCDSIDLNCRSLTTLTAITLPFMKKGSHIINVSSIASFAPTTRMAVYGATKSFVTSFSRALREELKKDGISVTAVCPGPMATEFIPVAKIEKGSSFAFDRLPYCNPSKVARGAVKASLKNRALYTPTAFYKLYRVLAKIIPHSLLIKFSKA